ncbi:MAG: CvpA family protein [candidate division KSB1 bacterium]|nr:CvpA family protein [candidate division KSB1 bacterium]MDZ7365262.1 CvpA family protein [candidate division KSB1 bacterium]MDZ7403129.1 CvpA family protein [candidate division KSB1 bacterium]
MAVEVSYADFTIIALMIIFGFEGYRAGFFKGILSISGFFFALVIAVVILPYSARFYNFVIELPANISIIMGFTTIFVLLLLLYALFLQWVHSIMKMEVVDWFNRISGTIIGLYKGLLTVSLLSLGFSLFPMPDLVKSTEARSVFMIPVKYVAPYNYNYIRKLNPYTPSFEETLKKTFAQMEKEPDEVATILLQEFGKRFLEKSVTNKR